MLGMLIMPSMHTDDVRAFLTVVDTGSISAAARQLYLTQPAVTRRLQRVEQTVGATLVDRRTRPVGLTDAGRAAIGHCRRLVCATDELKVVAQDGVGLSREIRIGVAHALTELALVDPVDRTQRRFPQAVLRLHTGWSRDLLERVRRGALDAAVILLPAAQGAPSGGEADAIGKERLVVVGPRTFRERRPALRDLGEVGWILNPEGCGARADLHRALARAGLPCRVAVETYNYELQLRLVARGRGLGLIPHRLLTRSPTRTRLRVLAVRDLPFALTIWLVKGELSDGLAAPIATFRDALTGRLRATRSESVSQGG